MDLRDRRVLVTGASSGLGREMAIGLARDYGAHPILVARRRERLDALRREIESGHDVGAHVLPADLSRPEDVDRVFEESTRAGPVDCVVLNAGVTYFGPHSELGWPEYESIVATNLTSVVRLTDLFVPYLIEQQRHGAVMIVTSLAGLIPTPYQAVYSGTKAFLTHFGQSLAEELHGRDVSLTVFAPGGIATEMNHKSGLAAGFEGSLLLQRPDRCAREGLSAMVARRRLAVPGWLNRAQLLLARFVPRRVATSIARRAYEQALAARREADEAAEHRPPARADPRGAHHGPACGSEHVRAGVRRERNVADSHSSGAASPSRCRG
jgi:hypothetical protein